MVNARVPIIILLIVLCLTTMTQLYGRASADSTITILSSFAGHNKASNDSILADTQIAAGPDYIVETGNYYFDIFTKQGELVSSQRLYSLFSAGSSDHIFNSRIIFDLDSQRFFAVTADDTNKAVRLAVSSSSDPTDEWYTYFFSIAPQCPDLPRVGASNDKIILSLDTYERLSNTSCSGGDTHGSQFFIIDKNDLVAGVESPQVQNILPDQTRSRVEPAQSFGDTDTIYMVENMGFFIRFYTVTGSVPNATLNSTSLSIDRVDDPPTAEQPGGTVTTNNMQVQDAAWYQGKLWLAFNTRCVPEGTVHDDSACIGLIQLDTEIPSVAQQFIYSPPAVGTHFYYPALSIDEDGNMIFIYGFSSSTDTYPSLAISGQPIDGPENTVVSPTVLKLGSAPETTGRYGDYFGASIDPSDRSVIWLAGQYVSSEFGSSVKWSTQIASTTLGKGSSLPPPSGCANGLCHLTVNTEDTHGSVIRGYWTVLSQNGNAIATGFSPASFSLNNGQQYSVAVADYGSYVFDHWKDINSNVRDRPVSINADTSVTAVYRNVNEPPPAEPDFTMSASPSSLTIKQGDSGSSTITVSSLNGFSSAVSLSIASSISGVSASVSPTSVTPSSGSFAASTLTVSIDSAAAPGNYQLTVTGMSGSTSHSANIALTVSSSTSTSTASKLTVNTQDINCNAISGYYTVLSHNGNAISTGFTPADFTLNNNQQYEAEVQDYGSFAFDHWKDTQSTTRNRSVSIAADAIITAIYKNLNNPSVIGLCSVSSSNNADFSVSASPSSVTVDQGGSSTSTITVKSLDGFSSAVTLNASPVSGLTASFSDNPVAPASSGQAQSVLTIAADALASPGIHQLTITGTSDSLSHSTTISVTTGQPQQQSTKINVKTVDSSGNQIFGYYTTLWQNGNLIQSAFSPAEFSVQNDQGYQVAVSDYGAYVFDHWSDGSRNRFHDVVAGDSVVAMYRP